MSRYACIPCRRPRFVVATLLLVAGGAVGCADDGSPPSVLALADLLDAAESPVPVDDSLSSPLGEVKDIVELSPDSVLVLQSNHPFGHLYGERGGFLAALGPRGRGPGELLDPWSAVRLDNHVWIQSRGEYFVWDLPRLDEVGRGRLPPGTLAIFRGCDGRLASLYEGRSAPESDTRRYGVQTLLHPGQTGDEGWTDLSGLTRSPKKARVRHHARGGLVAVSKDAGAPTGRGGRPGDRQRRRIRLAGGEYPRSPDIQSGTTRAEGVPGHSRGR